MKTYGQYCPVAQALEVIGNRWTLLIIRDMLTGTRHFNDLARGLPGISRGLLAKRLRQLETAGLVEKRHMESGQQTTEYHLTSAGEDIQDIINALLIWGSKWAFGDPSPHHLDPLLLMWWMHQRVNREHLPEDRIVIQFDFYGAKNETYWLVLSTADVTLCLTDPGYEINLLVVADLATFFKLWLGKIDYYEVIDSSQLTIEGIPQYVRAFPRWFAWSLAAPAVRAAESTNQQRT
ncbi:MAG: winged helix-turn-helix transcriptional regulator [Anaerolineae bacterium]